MSTVTKKCVCLRNKNEFGQTLFNVNVGEVGTIEIRKNEYTGKVTWKCFFKNDEFEVHDKAVLERTVEIK